MPRDPRQDALGDRVRIEHMLEAARDISKYVAGRSREDFETDSMLLRAIINATQQIGEAASNVSDEGRARAPALPWGQIVAMRHVLVHVYWGIDYDRLWKTATEDAPVLLAALEATTATWPLPPPPPESL